EAALSRRRAVSMRMRLGGMRGLLAARSRACLTGSRRVTRLPRTTVRMCMPRRVWRQSAATGSSGRL
ncbi:hypothetical protein M9458_049638, partial [Cirrhinus mrigala]